MRTLLACFLALLSMSLRDTALALALIPLSSSSSSSPRLQQRALALGTRRLSLETPTAYKKKKKMTRTRSCSLSMHMGHTHSHSHHDHSSQVLVVDPKTALHSRRRRIALFLFCGMAILGPPLVVKRRALHTSDLIAFCLTSTTLALVETTIRREIKTALTRIQNLTRGIQKHSTPITAKYFFRNDNAADRVTLLGGVINVFLSTGKFAVGVSCHSSALIADAGHSLSDLFSDVITLWAVQIGRLPPDDDHPYGHGKFEAIGSLFLALTLLGTGISVGAVSNKKLLDILAIQRSSGIHAQSLLGQIPTFPALAMAALSIVSKEWLYRITRQVGETLNSQVVIANAWHHRSDAYSSVLALISIGMAMFIPGFLAADAAAGILVAGMICMTGAEILGESIKQLTDTTNQALVDKVTAIIVNYQQDVSAVNRVRARQVGSSSIIDVSVSMPEDLTSSAARAIEEELKAKILKEDGVVDVDVRATSPGVVCPLLGATNTRPTASQVEKRVRSEILLNHPQVTSVQGVTVHYQDTFLVNVHVDIRMDPEVTTIHKAKSIAQDICNSLESGNQIHKANIFLDLNGSVNVRP